MDKQRFHLIGICGTAMASLAGMLKSRGFEVTGSDAAAYPPMSDFLASLSIPVSQPYAELNLKPRPDVVVVGNAISRGNLELEYVLDQRIPMRSLPQVLQEFFLRGRDSIVVAGTHGKTTTTSMLAWIFEASGKHPSFLIGGIAENFGSSFAVRQGQHFVIEGDEYDTAFFDKGPKFLHYHADGAIVTAVEFDHADIYRDLAHVQGSFRALAENMDASRVMAVCADFPFALEPTVHTAAKRITFGLRAGEIRATNIRINEEGARFAIERSGKVLVDNLLLSIGGRMNVANALGVWVLLKEFGVTDAELADGFASFRGVARRQEIVGEVGGVTIIDDFAHHPTAIRVTLEALAERFGPRRIIAAFEPRSNTARRAVFQNDFATAFDRARKVYLAPVYFKENDPIPADARLDVAALAETISSRGPKAHAGESIAAIVDAIASEAQPGDVIVGMSNGPFENLHARLRDAIAQRCS